MNSVTHTEPRSSISSSPKHCRNWATRRRLVHRCHFVKQRLRLATQTTIELLRIEKNGDRKVALKPAGLLKSGTVVAPDGVLELNKGFPGDLRIKPSEICCHRLEARLLADCSGGNSRLSYLLGCGGRSFFGYQNPCQVSNARTKAEMVATLFVELEAFMRSPYFSKHQSGNSQLGRRQGRPPNNFDSR
jgi:hypothetical protein